MSSSLKSQIDQDFTTAFKAKETQKKNALQLLRSALKQREVDERITLNDEQVLEVILSQIKQRKGSIEQYQDANRQDLVDQEQFELDVFSAYLPAAMSADEIEQAIQSAIQATGASALKDMGKVMAELKPHLQGRADMSAVSQQVRQLLSA